MHLKWLLFSICCIYPSVLCKPQTVSPVYIRGKTNNKTVLKQLLIPIDLSNSLAVSPSQLINRAQVQPHVVVEHKPTHFFYQAQAAQVRPQISLEYLPVRPSYHPNPGSTLGQVVPQGQPWPDSPEGYLKFSQTTNRVKDVSTTTEFSDSTTLTTEQVSLEDRLKESTTAKLNQVQTPISLEYKPVRPFYHPNPGDYIAQIIPPGKPLPSSAKEYENSSQVPSTLEDRLKETSKLMESSTAEVLDEISTTQAEAINKTVAPQTPSISLEYKPEKPFYYPSSGNSVTQIVPPGKPWPSGPEGCKNSSEVTPTLEDRLKETTTSTSTEISTTESLGSTSQSTENTVVVQSTLSPSISLEYQPIKPFYYPSAGNTVSQIVPPGQLWPDSVVGYINFSQITPDVANRNQDSSTSKPVQSSTISTTMEPRTQKPVILDYQPVRPSFHPNPGNNIQPIVPPGKPWPDSVEGYKNFSQTTPDLSNRNQVSSTTKPVPSSTVGTTKKSQTQTPTVLDYKPTRPFYHPNPGNNIAPIVPPGQPWPASAEDYKNVTQIALSIEDRIKDSSENSTPSTEKSTPINLEYEVTRPFYHPNPGDQISQIVPSGQPWPAKPEDYQNSTRVTPPLDNKFKETSPNPAQVGFIWEQVRDLGGSTLYTSNPDETETSTLTESTETSTTEQITTSGPLYTSSLTNTIKEAPVTEEIDEKLPPIRVVPFNLLPSRYFDSRFFE